MDRYRFWRGVILGFIVIILLAAVNVNTLGLIPVLGPLFGGIVAGFFGGRNSTEGTGAGLFSGIFGTAVVVIDFILKTGIVQVVIPHMYEAVGAALFLIAMVIYFLILSFIGGAIGGAIQKMTGKKTR